jgi:cytochrome P450
MRAGGMVAGWIRGDWRGLFAELRAECPVLATAAFTLVTKFADVHEVLAREKVFTVRPTRPQLDAALGSGFMLSRDATPLNWRERGLMQTMLAPRDVPAVRELVGRCADELLDGFAGGEPIEVLGRLFRPIALRVCEEYFGYRGVEAATLSRWVRDIIKDCYANPTGERSVHASAVASGAEMMGYLRSELGRRRSCPALDDVFGRLAALPLRDCPWASSRADRRRWHWRRVSYCCAPTCSRRPRRSRETGDPGNSTPTCGRRCASRRSSG